MFPGFTDNKNKVVFLKKKGGRRGKEERERRIKKRRGGGGGREERKNVKYIYIKIYVWKPCRILSRIQRMQETVIDLDPSKPINRIKFKLFRVAEYQRILNYHVTKLCFIKDWKLLKPSKCTYIHALRKINILTSYKF